MGRGEIHSVGGGSYGGKRKGWDLHFLRFQKQFPAPSEGLIQPQADVWLWHSCQALPVWMTWMTRPGSLQTGPAKTKGGEDNLYSADQEPSCWPGLGKPEALFQALMVSPVRGGQVSPLISPIDNPRDARGISQEWKTHSSHGGMGGRSI